MHNRRSVNTILLSNMFEIISDLVDESDIIDNKVRGVQQSTKDNHSTGVKTLNILHKIMKGRFNM